MAQQTTAPTTWESISTGSIVRIHPTNGDKPFYFMVMGVDPTREFSPMAWLRGLRVTAMGKPVPQIDHLHLGEHLRQELAHIDTVRFHSKVELSPTNGRVRKARKSA